METSSFPISFPFVSRFRAIGVAVETSVTIARLARNLGHPFSAIRL